MFIALYLIIGFIFTASYFVWFEMDRCSSNIQNRIFPDNPDVLPYLFLFMWLTWPITNFALILADCYLTLHPCPKYAKSEK